MAAFLKVTLVTMAMCILIEGGTWLHHVWTMKQSLPAYKPQHLVDFYRFYRVNPDYRTATVRINAAGFRNDEEIATAKPANIKRIVMMGGSTVWGSDAHYPFSGSIDNRDTIAGQLERILNARAEARNETTRVQVINAGTVGYVLFQNLIHFNHHVAAFNPDIVIAMDGHNDLDALVLQIQPYHHRNEGPLARAVNEPTVSDVIRQIIKFGEDHSLFIRKASTRVRELAWRYALEGQFKKQFDRIPSEAEIERWLNDYETTVRRLDASARIGGARALFVVQAEACGERHKSMTPEEVRIQQYWNYYTWLHTTGRDRLIDRLKQATSRHGIWFSDISDVFKEEKDQAYLDYTHLTSRGAHIVATRLADVIEARGWPEQT
ncbi:hypothetical protein [Nitrospira sp. Nam74]